MKMGSIIKTIEDITVETTCANAEVIEVRVEGWVLHESDYSFDPNRGILTINKNCPFVSKYVKRKWAIARYFLGSYRRIKPSINIVANL